MQKAESMKLSLEQQQRLVSRRQQMRDLWHDYQDELSRGGDKDSLAQKYGGQVFKSIGPAPTIAPEQCVSSHLCYLFDVH